MLWHIYKIITCALTPLVWLYVMWRKKCGKENPTRLRERFGFASTPHPDGPLVWLHAASVGESISALPLIEKIRQSFPNIKILITSGTVTSADLLNERLPETVIHQFIPVDTPFAVRRFLNHWQPDMAIFIESELWPNLILSAHKKTDSTMAG